MATGLVTLRRFPGVKFTIAASEVPESIHIVRRGSPADFLPVLNDNDVVYVAGAPAMVLKVAEAAELAEALSRRGIAAIVEPLLEIRYRTEPVPDLAGVQAVLCTSANGVRALARLSPARGVPLLAVGETTAARARAEGFGEVLSAGGNVDDLARLVAERLRPGDGSLLHVAGSVVAGDLAGVLHRRSFAVERAVL